MKAVNFHGEHGLRIDEADAPQEPGSGEVFIAPTFRGNYGFDLQEYEHAPTGTSVKPNPDGSAFLPQIPRHEFAARVLSSGERYALLDEKKFQVLDPGGDASVIEKRFAQTPTTGLCKR